MCLGLHLVFFPLYFFLRLFLDSDNVVSRLLSCEDELIELHLKSHGVAILGMLNEEYHQEGHNRGARIDDQLPRIAITEDWPRYGPDDYDCSRRKES